MLNKHLGRKDAKLLIKICKEKGELQDSYLQWYAINLSDEELKLFSKHFNNSINNNNKYRFLVPWEEINLSSNWSKEFFETLEAARVRFKPSSYGATVEYYLN